MASYSLRPSSAAVLLAACLAAAGAQAQTTTGSTSASSSTSPSSTTGRASALPYTHDGYVGISGGRSKYSLNSGPSDLGLGYDETDNAFKLYTGGYFHPNLGVEFGYLNVGKARRLGGDTKAQGFNLSLVGRAPLSEQLDVFGKIGTTYGRTNTTGMTATGATLGKEDGFGLSYGLGARWAFTPQWAAVVEWERHKFKFSDGDAPVNLTTVGLQYRF